MPNRCSFLLLGARSPALEGSPPLVWGSTGPRAASPGHTLEVQKPLQGTGEAWRGGSARLRVLSSPRLAGWGEAEQRAVQATGVRFQEIRESRGAEHSW